MSHFSYESQGTETMLVYHIQSGEHLDSFAKGMLQSNELEGILRPAFTQRDLEQYLKFQVTSKIPLKDFLSGEMERDTVMKLFLSIAGAVKEIQEYMLNPEKIILDTDYIFVDVRKKQVSLVYLPIDEFAQEIPVKEFLLHTLAHMRFRSDGDLTYVAKLIHFLNQPSPWEFDGLKRYIEKLMEEKPEPIQPVLKSVCQPAVAAVESSAPAAFSAVSSAREVSPVPTVSVAPIPVPPVSAAVPVPEVPLPESSTGKKKGGLFGGKEKKEAVKESRPEKSEKKKGGLFGLGKKKEVKPPVVPIVPVMAPEIDRSFPQPPVQEMIPPEPKKQIKSQPPVFQQPEPPKSLEIPKNPKPVIPVPAVSGNETVCMGQGSSDEDNRTVIMGGGTDYGATVLLGAETSGMAQAMPVVRIIRRRTGQSMVINQDSLRLGSEGSFVDFYIADNPAIGGCHADIGKRDGKWYITDRNSANHTYVNGTMAQPMAAVPLGNGAVIRLADEDFDFVIS